MRKVSVEERRARLGRKHQLAPDAASDDVTEVARSLVALHSTDPATVYVAVWARTRTAAVSDIEHALYEARSLVRLLGMRRTMWVVPTEMLPVVDAACTQTIATRQRRMLIQDLEKSGVTGDGAAWLTKVEAATHDALAARGQALGRELSTDVPLLRTQYSYAEGKAYGGTQTFTTRILNLMSMDGQIVRGRPSGKWNSSQYRWAPVEEWLPSGALAVDRADAQAELVEQWLGAFGPGTLKDIKWWTGLTVAEVNRALTRIDTAEVDLNGAKGLVLADDVGPVAAPDPWVALLPALDPTAMGWTERDWYLGEHRPALFDRSGNIGPTVWADGRIVGGWAQRKGGPDDGQVVFRLLEDVGADTTASVAAAAARLTTWLADVRIISRFRTPLDRELTA